MQCSEFDSVPFRGKFYTWKTYRGGEQGTEKVVRWRGQLQVEAGSWVLF